ncbi:neither inactivation nor afterpotential protein C isoform X2 [Panulirus ornatus]|uniref:neither inactivation nor afterpotential protein C isoform X2 n=1 Tax=Panulirus ornatus TaxID=150431 RepID=UPI003A893737
MVYTLLDAFGNAVTQLCADSTRHARYFDITFSKTGKVSGAIVWLLMLDKYRVTERPRGEGNFHIFYYLYDGLSQSSRLSRYGLKLGRKYVYLGKHPYDNEVTNAQKFTKVEEALQVIGFTEREIHTVYLVLAAILIIGNIDFTGDDQAAIADMEPVKEVCRLLDIEEKKLSWALCNYCRVKPDQTVESAKKNRDEAEMSRDALARTLYTRLLDFIINCINTNLSVTRLVFGDPYAIGVLDMFGFEANDHNSFENLLVNVANEQIQYYYNQYIFNWEMQDYSEEGIPVKNFTFPDNRHILELFLAKNNGIFSLLEEESRESEGSDNSLSYRLKQRVNQKQMQQVSEFTYAIAHYVGRVKYDLHSFVYKNRDHISSELIQTLRKSANDHIRGMFCNKLTKTGNLTVEGEDVKKRGKDKGGSSAATNKRGSRRFNTKSKGRVSQTRHVQTLGMNFRYSLIELLYKLTNSQPHFVRCIRSNMDNSSSIFDRDMIKHQIKYHAICDTIRIRQQGFSHRIPYQEFLRRYQFLAFEFDETVDMTKDNARLLLLRLKMEGWAIGKDKVFLKYYTEEFLSRLYESSVKKIVKIQAMMRAYMQRKKKRAQNKAAASKPVQDNFRGYKARQENPEVANKIKQRERFGEQTIEAEAARYVQYYFRKWKMRTMFQQLQIYRADKQQHLVYFSQQVHLYGQEMQAKLQRLNNRLDLATVRNEAPGAHKTMLVREKIAQPKLALDHMLNAYFDTTFLCDPSRAKKGRQTDDDWEAPFKSRAAASRAANMGLEDDKNMGGAGNKKDFGVAPMDVRSKTAMFDQGQYSNNYGQNNYGGGSSYNKVSAGNSYNRFAGSNNVTKAPAYNQYTGNSYLKNAAPKPPVVVNSWSDRQHNGYSDNNMEEEDQGTHDFRKHLRKTNRSAIREMEERAAASGGESEGTFNFQPPAGRGRAGGAKPRASHVPLRTVKIPPLEELQQQMNWSRGESAQKNPHSFQQGRHRGAGGNTYLPGPIEIPPAQVWRPEELQERLKGLRSVPPKEVPYNFQLSDHRGAGGNTTQSNLNEGELIQVWPPAELQEQVWPPLDLHAQVWPPIELQGEMKGLPAAPPKESSYSLQDEQRVGRGDNNLQAAPDEPQEIQIWPLEEMQERIRETRPEIAKPAEIPATEEQEERVKETHEEELAEDSTNDSQGMLRRTNHSRDSMKRGEGGASYANGRDSATTPTFTEETEEAML